MKQLVRQNQLTLLLTVAVLTVTMTPACAQDPGKKEPRSVQVSGGSTPALTTVQAKVATTENKQRKLLDELLEPETAKQTERTGKEDSCALDDCTSTPPTGGITHE